jgi:hypothetical protein
VLVYFHGDIWVGARKTSKAYLESSSDKLQADAEAWGKRPACPVFIGRPGTHGSSGDPCNGGARTNRCSLGGWTAQRRQVDEFVIAGQAALGM